MTGKAPIKQAELLRTAKVTKEIGVTIEVATGDGTTIRISPALDLVGEPQVEPRKRINL